MSATMTGPAPLEIKDSLDALPDHIQLVVMNVIEELNGATPTRATIERIRRDPAVKSTHDLKVLLKFFMIESELSVSDELQPLIQDLVGSKDVVMICREAKRTRRYRMMQDWKPRWGNTQS